MFFINLLLLKENDSFKVKKSKDYGRCRVDAAGIICS